MIGMILSELRRSHLALLQLTLLHLPEYTTALEKVPLISQKIISCVVSTPTEMEMQEIMRKGFLGVASSSMFAFLPFCIALNTDTF